MALHPFWGVLGLGSGEGQQPGGGDLVLGLRLLQAGPQKQAHLARGVAGLLSASGDLEKSASAAALILMLLLGQQEHIPTAATGTAAGSTAEQAGGGWDGALLHMQAIMATTQVLVRQAFGAGPDAAAAAFCGLWLLPELLAQHSAPLRHPEVFAALAAAASVVDFGGLAVELARRGNTTSATQLQQRLLQHILGAAASGLLYARAQKGSKQHKGAAAAAGAGSLAGTGILQQAFQQGNGPVGAVWILMQQQQQRRQQQQELVATVKEVRQSYLTLLDNLSRAGAVNASSVASAGAAGAAHNSSSSSGGLHGPSEGVPVQLCVALLNWASYEASLGAWGQACRHVLDAVSAAQQYQASTGAASMLQACFMGAFTAVHATGLGTNRSPGGPVLRQGQQQQQSCGSVWLEVLLSGLHAQGHVQQDVRSSSSSSKDGSVLAALQHPGVVYELAGVREQLSTPGLLLPHALLWPGALGRLLQPLAPREVRGLHTNVYAQSHQ
jgi:hypothetical protein